jgi:hypothetical protein
MIFSHSQTLIGFRDKKKKCLFETHSSIQCQAKAWVDSKAENCYQERRFSQKHTFQYNAVDFHTQTSNYLQRILLKLRWFPHGRKIQCSHILKTSNIKSGYDPLADSGIIRPIILLSEALYHTQMLYIQASIEEGQRKLTAYKQADKFES